MDGITPVGTAYQQNPVQTLSGLMGVKSQQADIALKQQQLQTGQYTQQSAQALSQQNTQDARNRQAAQQFFQNFDIAKHAGTDGTLSLDSVMSDPGFKQLGDATPGVLSNMVDIKNKQLDGISKMSQLSSEFRNQSINFATGMQRDKDVQAGSETGKGKVVDGFNDFIASAPPAAQSFLQPFVDRLKATKAQDMPAVLKNYTLQNQNAEKIAQSTLPQPGTMDRGGSTDTGMVDPSTGAFTPNQNFQKTTTPGIYTLPNKQLGVMGGGSAPPPTSAMSPGFFRAPPASGGASPPSTGGGAPSTGGGAPQHLGRSGSTVLTAANDPNRPKPNDPGAVQDAWNQSVQKAQQDVRSARDTDANYGNSMAVASEIRKLSAETDTGPGSERFKNVVGAITSRFGGSQGVTNTQTLESFLDRQAANFRDGMDLPKTNAGVEQARAIGGNIGMQGGAIQAKNSYNEALAQGLHDYRTGLDHVEQFTGNASPTQVNKFKSAWAQNFDPLAYEWKLSMQRGDRAAANAITSSMSPQDRAALQQRGRNLDLLSQGKMP
jgi:hypothetical protein